MESLKWKVSLHCPAVLLSLTTFFFAACDEASEEQNWSYVMFSTLPKPCMVAVLWRATCVVT